MLVPLAAAASTFLAFAITTYASPTTDFAVKHSWAAIPHGWELLGTPDIDYPIDLRISLKQHRIDELIGSLYEVSDPLHPRYGQHLSKSEVEELTTPHQTTTALVFAWLDTHDIPRTTVRASPAGDTLALRLSRAKADAIFAASFRTYQHTVTGAQLVRTLSYSLPRTLHAHVDLVHPTTAFDSGKTMRLTSHVSGVSTFNVDQNQGSGTVVKGPAGQDVPISCNTTVTPSCLQALYRTEGYVPQAADKGNKLGINGFLEQFINFADLQMFYEKFRPDALGANVTVVSVDGGLNNQSVPGVEANLDTQYTTGLTFPTPNIFYTTPGTAPTINDSVTPPQRDEPYLTWLEYVLALDDAELPQVFTTSYGGDEQTFPKEWAVRVCNMFAQLGARGSSVMFSSGDGGVGAGTCLTNDGTNRTLFQPVFPATCPYVTGVGATYGVAPERGTTFSQGGFSVYFPRPAYQAAAVPPFLAQLGTTYRGLFNPAGRAVPDVSAQGEGFQVVVGGQVESVGGTSASSPTFAGIVALLNDARLSRGASSLGFLNPLLYSVGSSAFTDILAGNNPGCGTPGFNATTGWDGVTGLGTPT